jgi:dTDP-glucose 4,6-dehydratase
MSDYVHPLNLGNPDEISLLDFAKEILQLTGSNQKIAFKPLPVDDPKQRQPDITKAKSILQWEPKIDRAEGLARTYDYFKGLSKEELEKEPLDFNHSSIKKKS